MLSCASYSFFKLEVYNQNCTEMLKNSLYCVNRLVIITSEKDRVSKGTLNTHDFRQVLQ